MNVAFPAVRNSGRYFYSYALRPLLHAALLLALTVGAAAPLCAQNFDLIIANGRVLDPESGLDAIRNIGIRSGKIVSISRERLKGRKVIDAAGLVVAPGFIDLHAHGQTVETYRYQALDGVTTALELEVGTADVERWYLERKDGRLINYGVSVGHIPVRMAVLHDPGTFLPSGDAAHRVALPAELAEIARRIEDGLKKGAVSIGAGLPYTESAAPEEVREVFRIAGRHNVPIHVHIRSGVAGLDEVLKLAASTKAPLHIAHINSSGGSATPDLLQMIVDARKRHLDVTTEAYPYAAGMTEIQSAILDAYENSSDERLATLEWPKTGERLNRKTFRRYRASGGPVIIHSNTEDIVAAAINNPLTMIASDSYWENGTGHPRTTGTYAKVLGRYARDAGSLTLMEAIRKMTLMPAQRLEVRVHAMRAKGRLRVGGDADVTVFNAARVRDRSTYREPTLPPDGIEYVIVNGVPVVASGRVVEGVAPGRPVRAPLGLR
jgi:cytosine/adenosine deaminase-related metal-dependent hydrolase